jgi:hypothetical protein
MTGHTDFVTAQAYALFVSDLSCHTEVTDAGTRAAIHHAMRACGGAKGCAAAAAHEYGEHPDSASQRMRWARNIVTALYSSTPHISSVAIPSDPAALTREVASTH